MKQRRAAFTAYGGAQHIPQVPDRGDEAESKEDQGVCRPLLILATALAPVIGYDKVSRIEHYAMDNEVITQSSLGAALTVSWQRFVGTMLGTVVGAIVASQFGPM